MQDGSVAEMVMQGGGRDTDGAGAAAVASTRKNGDGQGQEGRSIVMVEYALHMQGKLSRGSPVSFCLRGKPLAVTLCLESIFGQFMYYRHPTAIATLPIDTTGAWTVFEGITHQGKSPVHLLKGCVVETPSQGASLSRQQTKDEVHRCLVVALLRSNAAAPPENLHHAVLVFNKQLSCAQVIPFAQAAAAVVCSFESGPEAQRRIAMELEKWKSHPNHAMQGDAEEMSAPAATATAPATFTAATALTALAEPTATTAPVSAQTASAKAADVTATVTKSSTKHAATPSTASAALPVAPTGSAAGIAPPSLLAQLGLPYAGWPTYQTMPALFPATMQRAEAMLPLPFSMDTMRPQSPLVTPARAMQVHRGRARTGRGKHGKRRGGMGGSAHLTAAGVAAAAAPPHPSWAALPTPMQQLQQPQQQQPLKQQRQHRHSELTPTAARSAAHADVPMSTARPSFSNSAATPGIQMAQQELVRNLNLNPHTYMAAVPPSIITVQHRVLHQQIMLQQQQIEWQQQAIDQQIAHLQAAQAAAAEAMERDVPTTTRREASVEPSCGTPAEGRINGQDQDTGNDNGNGKATDNAEVPDVVLALSPSRSRRRRAPAILYRAHGTSIVLTGAGGPEAADGPIQCAASLRVASAFVAAAPGLPTTVRTRAVEAALLADVVVLTATGAFDDHEADMQDATSDEEEHGGRAVAELEGDEDDEEEEEEAERDGEVEERAREDDDSREAGSRPNAAPSKRSRGRKRGREASTGSNSCDRHTCHSSSTTNSSNSSVDSCSSGSGSPSRSESATSRGTR